MDNRMVAFLFLSFFQNTNRRLPFQQKNKDTPKAMNNLDMVIYLLGNSLPINFRNLEISFSNQEIDWIENNERQRRWIIRKLQSERSFRDTSNDVLFPERIISGFSPKQLTTLTLDVISTYDKLIKVTAKQYEREWKEFNKNNSLLAWFKDDTKGKIECLTKRYEEKFDDDCFINNVEDIAILIDTFELNNQQDKLKNLFDSIKSLHQKRTFKKRHKDKEQCNVMLPTDLLKRLKKQAVNHGVTRSQLIQKILIQAMNDKTLLDQLLANDFTIKKPDED